MLPLLRRLRHGPLKFLDPFWRLLGRIHRKMIAGSGLTTHQRIGPYGPFRLDAKFAFSNFANWGGAHNGGFAHCIEACRGKACVLDIGGHIGLVALPAASVMAPSGRLVAFEPAAANRKLLTHHVKLNGMAERVTVEGMLVGEKTLAEVEFYEMDDATGMNSVAPGAMGAEYRRVGKPQVSLDDYCRDHGLSPDVIKIDVEGAELGVLSGARWTLAQHSPLVFLSVHPRQIALLGGSVDELATLIASLGYVCRHVDGSPVHEFALSEYVLTPKEE